MFTWYTAHAVYSSDLKLVPSSCSLAKSNLLKHKVCLVVVRWVFMGLHHHHTNSLLTVSVSLYVDHYHITYKDKLTVYIHSHCIWTTITLHPNTNCHRHRPCMWITITLSKHKLAARFTVSVCWSPLHYVQICCLHSLSLYVDHHHITSKHKLTVYIHCSCMWTTITLHPNTNCLHSLSLYVDHHHITSKHKLFTFTVHVCGPPSHYIQT